MKRTLHNLNEVQALAQELAARLRGGEVWLLSGPLGAGKTTFVQALARELGVQDIVNSPTYTIAAEYAVPDHNFIKTLVHVDLYRLSEHAGGDPAVRDVLERAGKERLTVIEWAERLGESVPAGTWIRFDYGDEAGERVVMLDD